MQQRLVKYLTEDRVFGAQILCSLYFLASAVRARGMENHRSLRIEKEKLRIRVRVMYVYCVYIYIPVAAPRDCVLAVLTSLQLCSLSSSRTQQLWSVFCVV